MIGTAMRHVLSFLFVSWLLAGLLTEMNMSRAADPTGLGVSRAADPMGIGATHPIDLMVLDALNQRSCKRPPREVPRTVTKLSVPNWPGCAPYRDSLPVTKLCKSPAGPADWRVRTYLGNRLRGGPKYLASLCEIDAAIVQAQRDCELGSWHANERMIEGLMRSLADSWKLYGAFERADQLYAQAFASRSAPGFMLWTTDILMGWADLKVRMGDAENARKLARQQTEIERQEYASGYAIDSETCLPTPLGIVHALKFEAGILERLGFDGEAHALRQEMEELSPTPGTCEGVCGG